ncbi:MAG TPA: hypothetical protein VHH88_12190, partial [Verrucomicrobiae bacterium]|nr:hypothetical protein [Verrucomicrobiae bacterium]
MKEKLAVLILCLASATALAQTSGNNPATSSSSSSAASTSASEDQSAAALSFTNSTGETFSVDQLAAELRSLRGTVQRTLPMLSAFNMQYSNAAAGSESIRGRLGGFLSNALKNRTSGEGTASSTSTSSLVVSNLMS